MQKKMKLYSQLSEGQRFQISVLRVQGQAMREIAKAIGVNASTICRELKRNSNGSKYIPQKAHQLCVTRKSNAFKVTKITNEHMDYIKEQFKSPTTRNLHNMSNGLAFKYSHLTAIDKAC